MGTTRWNRTEQTADGEGQVAGVDEDGEDRGRAAWSLAGAGAALQAPSLAPYAMDRR
jgi:hypothetical protein